MSIMIMETNKYRVIKKYFSMKIMHHSKPNLSMLQSYGRQKSFLINERLQQIYFCSLTEFKPNFLDYVILDVNMLLFEFSNMEYN